MAFVRTKIVRYPLILLAIILLIAISLRFFALTTLPNGVNQDEASAGYESYSLIHHGTDRWGNKWPAYFISWGSGQNALLSYLDMPVIKLLGLNVLSIRLVPAILGVLSIVVLYLLLRRNKLLAFVACFLLAICPWAVLASRWGLESNILPFFILLGIYTFTTGIKRWWWPFSLIPFGLALYAYIVFMFVLPLLLVGMFFVYRKEIRQRLVPFALSLVILLAVTIPIGVFITENFVLRRVPRVFTHLPFTAPVLLQSRLAQVQNKGQISDDRNNIHFYTSGMNDDQPWVNQTGYIANLYISLAIIGCVIVFREPDKKLKLFGVWLVASCAAGFVTPLNEIRGNSFLIPSIVLGSFALFKIVQNLKDKELRRTVGIVSAVLLVGYSCVFFQEYFTQYNKTNAYEYFNVGLDKALAVAQKNPDTIYVSQTINLNYMYALFYLKADAKDFQKNSVYAPAEVYSQKVYQVENYRNYYFDPLNPALQKSYTYVLKDTDVISCKKMVTTYAVNGWRVGRCEQ